MLDSKINDGLSSDAVGNYFDWCEKCERTYLKGLNHKCLPEKRSFIRVKRVAGPRGNWTSGTR